MCGDAPDDGRFVADERQNIVQAVIADHVPAVVSVVVYYDIETIEEQRLDGIVGINRKSVTVTGNDPPAERTPRHHLSSHGGCVPYGSRTSKPWLGARPRERRCRARRTWRLRGNLPIFPRGFIADDGSIVASDPNMGQS